LEPQPVRELLLDTNVVLDLWLFKDPRLEALRRLLAAGQWRWIASEAMLIELATLLLKPGGRIVYIVCSLLPAEGEAQLAATPNLGPWQSRVLTPADDGCDGFFIAQSSRL
jgi:16S rRNA (cytosine967-C5)-methyltransferase